jgi:hypothetical protein
LFPLTVLRLSVVALDRRVALILPTVPRENLGTVKIAGKKIGRLRPGTIIRDLEKHRQGWGAEKGSRPIKSKAPVI